MDENKEIQAKLNDDNLIKLSHKRTGALKKLFKKVMNGAVTVVSHVPGAKFIVPKITEKIGQIKENVLESQMSDEALTPKPVLDVKEPVKTPEPKPVTPVQESEKQTESSQSTSIPETTIFGTPVSVEPEHSPMTTENEDFKEPEQEKKPIKTIFPKKLLASKPKIETAPITEEKPLKVAEPTVQESTPIDLNILGSINDTDINNKVEEEQKTQVSDNDHLKESRKQYGDLIKFNTWQEYFHSFSKEEVEKKNEDGTMLKGTDFISIRLDQAETIKRITQAEETERQATISSLKIEIEDRITKVQANRDKVAELKQEITARNKETAELNAENKKARIQVNSLNNESKEANDKIDEMDDIIGQLTDPDYQPKRKAETKKVDSKTLAARKRVNEITKELEKELEDNKKKDEIAKVSAGSKAAAKKEVAKAKKATKTVEIDAPKVKKTTTTKEIKPKVVVPQVQEASLADELADFDNEKVETPKSVVLESTNPDYPGTFTVGNSGLSASWKNSPMTKEDFNMGFDNDTRAKIGQEAYDKFLNSDGSLSFDEAKDQVAEQYTQSKGRTK